MKFTLVLLTSGLVFAGCSKSPEENQVKFETTSIKVETAQCGSCASAITKALKKVDGVHKADVDIDKKVATVKFASDKASITQLEDAVTKAGYSANDKKSDPTAYEKLDECCKVE